MDRPHTLTASDLTVIVPCYNEAEVVEGFYADLVRVLERLDLA